MTAPPSGRSARDGAGGLPACREAVERLLRGDTVGGWPALCRRLGLPVTAEGRLSGWSAALAVAAGVEPLVVVGAVPAALRTGVGLDELAATVPLELLMPKVQAPRVRLRLAARGFVRRAEGWLTAPGGATVVVRERLVPAGFGRLPALVFAEGAEAVDLGGLPLPLAAPGPSWAAALLRAGIELLAGSPWAAPHLLAASLEVPRLEPAERALWQERLRRWGAGRLVAPVVEAADWVAGAPGEPPPLPAPTSPPTRRRRLLAGLRLQEGPLAALRFAAVELLAPHGGGWD